uniref:Ubiquitin carboxyl-terminal hydrolase MINDY n=1 Tax=Macrostomum lignano TaxID=282301 RepID=A0A1I8FBW8_9PLAT
TQHPAAGQASARSGQRRPGLRVGQLAAIVQEAAGGAGQQQGEAGRRQLLVVVEQRSLRRAVPVGLDAQEAARQHQAVEEQQGSPGATATRFGEQCRAPRRLHGQQVGAEPVRTVGREQQAAQQLGPERTAPAPWWASRCASRPYGCGPEASWKVKWGAAPLLAEGVDGVAEGDLAEAQGLAAADRGAAEHPVEAADPGALDRRQRRGVGGPQAKHNFPARLARLRLRLRRHRQRVLALQRHPFNQPQPAQEAGLLEGGILHEAQQPVQPRWSQRPAVSCCSATPTGGSGRAGRRLRACPSRLFEEDCGCCCCCGSIVAAAAEQQQQPQSSRTDDWDSEDAFQRDRTRLWESLNSRKRLDVDSNGLHRLLSFVENPTFKGGQLPAQKSGLRPLPQASESDRVALKREDTLPMPAEAEAEPSQPRRKIVLGLRPAYTAPLPPIQRSGVGSFHRMLGGAPIGRGEALRLRQVTFGNAVHPFCKEWRRAHFTFQEASGPHPYGLLAHRDATRALVLCVQAQLLRRLLFPADCPDRFRTHLLAVEPARRPTLLAESLADILWRAGEGRRAALAAPSSECHVPSDDQYREDGFTERLHLFYFTSLPELLDGLRRLENYTRPAVGSMLRSPRFPIWLVRRRGQAGLLFSTHSRLMEHWRSETAFHLYYYTGLASHTFAFC